MKVLFDIGQSVDVNSRQCRIAGMTEYLLDVQGKFDNCNYYLGQPVAVNGIRFTIIGIDSEYLHLEICGEYTMGEA